MTQRLVKVSCKHPRKHRLFRNIICTPTVSFSLNTCASATIMHCTPEVHSLNLYPLSRLSTIGRKMVICGNNDFYSADTLLSRFPQYWWHAVWVSGLSNTKSTGYPSNMVWFKPPRKWKMLEVSSCCRPTPKVPPFHFNVRWLPGTVHAVLLNRYRSCQKRLWLQHFL